MSSKKSNCIKSVLLLCSIFLFGKQVINAQVLTFDGQGYTNNQALGNPYSITNSGETFRFTISNGGAPNATDNIYRMNENSCGNSGFGHLYAGNFSATTWTIETSDGGEIDLGTIRFDNVFPCFAFEYNLTIEGFKDGSSTGTQAFTVPGMDAMFTSNSNFDDVDIIVITASDLANLGIDDIEFESILPVELINFKARVDKGVELSWQTASELNNERFEIEESKDGIRFEKIGEIKGNGTTYVQQEYSFTIDDPRNGLMYYRLKQIDFDDRFEYSKVISLNFTGESEAFGKIYPNPNKNGLVNLEFTAQNNEEITLEVFDSNGKLIAQRTQEVIKGRNDVSFNFSSLETGLYLFKIGNENITTYQKVFIEK